MRKNWFRRFRWECLALGVLILANTPVHARTQPKSACVRVSINGQVTAGHAWSASLGEGWIFRILPIAPSSAGYSGWDLVVDRQQPAGFPDALLLATMPYNSINEREIGTTFGLRSQDAIGWNPRSFRFILNVSDFLDAQQRFRSMMATGAATTVARSARATNDSPAAGGPDLSRLMELERHAPTGELRILDAGIVPGVADPAPYAQAWALAASRTPHQIEAAPSVKSSPLGTLNWMKFSLTLWLPEQWRVPSEVHFDRAACPN